MIDYNKIQVRVRLDNLRHNYRLFRQISDNIIPVVKSDAYGHGLAEVAQALQGEAQTFAVGFVNEAVSLRQSGCSERILSLLGPQDDGDFAALWAHDIVAVMTNRQQLEKAALYTEKNGALEVAVKFDTGMHRLGFRPDAVGEIVDFFREHERLKPVMVCSHLASADEPDSKADVTGQSQQFQIVVDAFKAAGFPVEASLSNSAASLAHTYCHYDSLRLGIAMYGGNPFHGTDWAALGSEVRPAMEVSAPILQVHPLKKGEGISYGWTHVAKRNSMVAIVGVGYSDNYSRSMSNVGFMNIKGSRVPVLGRVCMQMTAVDVTDIIDVETEVVPGDRAWLLGGPEPGTISPEELARWWKTITYEVFCLLGMNPREFI